jgi:hypothetical protein
MNRYKINSKGDALISAPKTVVVGGKVIKPTDEILSRMGFLPLQDIPAPELNEGDTLITKYEYVTEEFTREPSDDNPRRKPKTYTRRVAIKPIYEVISPPPPPEPVYTYDDYNRALEDYLRKVRSDRGYTDREPTEYIGSKVPRWDSDGKDYRSFRDDVMLYALPILNEYKETGKAPTLEEFKAGFPKITWSYTEEM